MLKRTRSEGDLQLLQKEAKTLKTVDKDALLKAIRRVVKPELEEAWRNEQQKFSIVVVDTYSLKKEQKSVAKCICETKWEGNLYVLRIHGGILSFPFWKKMETPTKQAIKDFFSLTGYEKRGSPTYMTMYWLHHALQRSKTLQKVNRIVVMTNNFDDPFDYSKNRSAPKYDFLTDDGAPLQYQIDTVSGKAVQAAVIDALRPLLNEKWILMTRNPYARKRFLLLQKNTFMILLNARNYEVLTFQLSKVLRVKAMKPNLKQKQVVHLDRSEEEMKRYAIVYSTLQTPSEMQAFLEKHTEAVVINVIEGFIKKNHPDYGSYLHRVSGCIFETSAEQHCVQYLVQEEVKLALKGRVVTLQKHESLDRDYLLRPQNTKYKVESVTESLVEVKDLKTKQILPVPKCFINEN